MKISKKENSNELENFIVNKMCKVACKFYKEGEEVDENEKLECGGFKVLRHQVEKGMINRDTLENLANKISKEKTKRKVISKLDKNLVKNLCKITCGFYTEGEHGVDEDLQCGGYKIIRYQLETGIIDFEIIKKISEKEVNT